MSRWDAFEIDTASPPPRKRASRKHSSPLLGVLMTAVVFAMLLLAFVLFVWKPNRERKLTEYYLRTVALLYHEYYSEHGKAPSSLVDLENYTPADPLGLNPPDTRNASRAFEMIRDGRVVVTWNAVFSADGEENDKYVLGYEADAAENGGLVMLGGGSVRYIAADAFKALPKIQTQSAYGDP